MSAQRGGNLPWRADLRSGTPGHSGQLRPREPD